MAKRTATADPRNKKTIFKSFEGNGCRTKDKDQRPREGKNEMMVQNSNIIIHFALSIFVFVEILIFINSPRIETFRRVKKIKVDGEETTSTSINKFIMK